MLMSAGIAAGGPAWGEPTAGPASPDVASSPLPEIGRTRSRALCTTLREVVAPAILRTKDADNEFSAARSAIFESVAGDAAGRAMTNRKVERALDAMTRHVLALGTLLGDRRLAGATDDAATGTEKASADVRVAMRVLYESESRQLNALNAFVETGRRTELMADDEEALGMKAALKDIVPPPRAANVAGRESYLGAPPRYTNKLAEANEIDRWIGRVVAITNKREDLAGKVITAAAALCR